MDFKLYENIHVEIPSELMGKKYKNSIKIGFDYFCKEFKVQPEKANIQIIFSNDYQTDLMKYHYQPEKMKDDNSNASFIPKIYQNEETRKKDFAIIVVNLKKLIEGKASEVFIESVIIHELVHYFDYYMSYQDAIVVKYGNIHETSNKKDESIFAYFQKHSELRAKYYQEEYMVTSHTFFLDNNHILKYLTKVDETNPEYYDLAHAWAQLMCWEKYALREYKDLIVEKKKWLLQVEAKNQIPISLTEIFDLKKFCEYCDTLNP